MFIHPSRSKCQVVLNYYLVVGVFIWYFFTASYIIRIGALISVFLVCFSPLASVCLVMSRKQRKHNKSITDV